MTKQPVLEIVALIASVLGILFMFSTVHAAASTSACTTITASLSSGSDDGSKIGNVTALQAFLKTQGLFSVAPNGHFGPITLTAVKAFQTSHKLEAVGSVGPLTRAAIHAASCVQTTPSAPAPAPTSVAPTSTPAAPAPVPALVAPTPAPVATTTNISLPYLAPSFSAWTSTWGDVSMLDGGSLMIQAGTSTTGAEAVLLGSRNWTDYRVTANVLSKNSEIVMIARYINPDNLLLCTFSDNYVSIKQRIKGITTTVASAVVPGMSGSLSVVRSTAVAMRVQGKSVGCSQMGPTDNITFENVDPSLLKGGIGFDTWNQNVNFASLQVYSVQATAL